MRSALTALGVIIGIIAVTLMGSAIGGHRDGLRAQPRGHRRRHPLRREVAVAARRRLVELSQPPDRWTCATRRSSTASSRRRRTPQLVTAVPTINTIAQREVRRQRSARRVHAGDHRRFPDHLDAGVQGRTFLQRDGIARRPERGASSATTSRRRCSRTSPPLGKTVMIGGTPFRVLGVYAKQGTFLGLFSFDTYAVVPLRRVHEGLQRAARYVDPREGAGQEPHGGAKGELTGAMRRVRGLQPELPQLSSGTHAEGLDAMGRGLQGLDPHHRPVAGDLRCGAGLGSGRRRRATRPRPASSGPARR